MKKKWGRVIRQEVQRSLKDTGQVVVEKLMLWCRHGLQEVLPVSLKPWCCCCKINTKKYCLVQKQDYYRPRDQPSRRKRREAHYERQDEQKNTQVMWYLLEEITTDHIFTARRQHSRHKIKECFISTAFPNHLFKCESSSSKIKSGKARSLILKRWGHMSKILQAKKAGVYCYPCSDVWNTTHTEIKPNCFLLQNLCGEIF